MRAILLSLCVCVVTSSPAMSADRLQDLLGEPMVALPKGVPLPQSVLPGAERLHACQEARRDFEALKTELQVSLGFKRRLDTETMRRILEAATDADLTQAMRERGNLDEVVIIRQAKVDAAEKYRGSCFF